MKDFSVSPGLKVVSVFAALHLLLAACGAFEITPFSNRILNFWLNYYGDLTGASASYGFFAPGVDLQIRALFDVEHADGVHESVQLENGRNSEFYLRTGDIIENFYNDDVDDPMKFQRDLATSLSGSIFARYPDAKSVTIHLDKFIPVNMPEYRAGQRPDWQAIYSAKFTKRALVKR